MKYVICLLTLMLTISNCVAKSLDRIVAVVNEQPITERELQSRMGYFRQQYLMQKKSLPEENAFKREVLDSIINRTIQIQLAEQHNIDVSQDEIKGAIDNVLKTNRISLSELKTQLRSENQTYDQYVEEIKEELTISKLQQQLVQDIQITEEEVNEFIRSFPNQRRKNKIYHVLDLKIALPDSPSSSQVVKAKELAEKLIQKGKKGMGFEAIASAEKGGAVEAIDFGDRALAEIPDMFAHRISEMKPNEIVGPLLTANGLHILKLKNVKTIDNDEFITQSQVRHILIKPDVFNGDYTQAAIKANEVHQAILSGSKFEAMAKRHSQDPVSASKGGDLGWVVPGDLPPTLETLIEKLKPGQISKPIRSSAGFHIVQVISKRKTDASAELERKSVFQMLHQRKLQEKLEKWLHQIKQSAFIKIIPA